MGPHLSVLAAPGARFLYVGPSLDAPQVPQCLEAVGWQLVSKWRISVLAHAPTWAHWLTRCAFLGQEAHQEEWDARAGSLGMPYREERYVVLAQRNGAD